MRLVETEREPERPIELEEPSLAHACRAPHEGFLGDRVVAIAVRHARRRQPFGSSEVHLRGDAADASGDRNPPHVDENFARAIGYKGVFLQGLCTMAFASQAAIRSLASNDPRRLRRLKVRFSKIVFPGDELTTLFWSAGDGTYSFETQNQNGDLVIRDGLAEIEESRDGEVP